MPFRELGIGFFGRDERVKSIQYKSSLVWTPSDIVKHRIDRAQDLASSLKNPSIGLGAIHEEGSLEQQGRGDKIQGGANALCSRRAVPGVSRGQY